MSLSEVKKDQEITDPEVTELIIEYFPAILALRRDGSESKVLSCIAARTLGNLFNRVSANNPDAMLDLIERSVLAVEKSHGKHDMVKEGSEKYEENQITLNNALVLARRLKQSKHYLAIDAFEAVRSTAADRGIILAFKKGELKEGSRKAIVYSV